MKHENRNFPHLTLGDFCAQSRSVCGIDDIIGTPADECVHHYSAPDVEYDYGYDYVNVLCEKALFAYYIGVDRFFHGEEGWRKEYFLYEYAVFDDEDPAVNELLLSHLETLARQTGCCRILCKSEGGNPIFYQLLAENGFALKDGKFWMKAIPDGEMSTFDKLVIPTAEDKLTFEQLFFLREHGFELDENTCTFVWQEDYICIDRKTGICSFSENIQSVGEPLILDGMRALCQIDVCHLLLKIGVNKPILLYPLSAKKSDTTPEIYADGIGIFVPEQKIGFRERNAFRMKLKQEGNLKKYGFYSYHFNLETGGEFDGLAFSNV